jgi:AraC family transcriptional regulator
VTFDHLLALSGCGPSQFRGRFRATFGCTPHDFVRGIQIAEAKARLRVSMQAIGEIAMDLGFSSASHFSTEFKRRTGLAPSDYVRLKKSPLSS